MFTGAFLVRVDRGRYSAYACGHVRCAALQQSVDDVLLIASLFWEGAAALRLPTLTEAAAFGYLGALVTAAAFFLWYDALRRLGPGRAGLFAGLVPVGALLTTAALGLGEVRVAHVAGALLVAAGVVIGMQPPRAAVVDDSDCDGRRIVHQRLSGD